MALWWGFNIDDLNLVRDKEMELSAYYIYIEKETRWLTVWLVNKLLVEQCGLTIFHLISCSLLNY